MKDNILRYVLAVSLLLNISLLGAAGYTHYKQSRQRMEAPFGYGCIQGQTTPSGSYVQGHHLFQKLSLKPEQTKIFQQKAVLFHAALDKKRQEIDRLRGALFDLMRADKPDKVAMEASITQINRIQEDMQKMVVAHMLEFKAILDNEQQKKFLDLIEGAMAQRKESMGS